MKSLVKFFAKKYLLSIVNDLLESAKNKTDINLWKNRTKNIIDFCNLILKTLEDDKISPEEVDAIIENTKKLFV